MKRRINITGLQKDIKYWLDVASYDFKTAEAMLKTARYLYVLFACQQAIEKTLKALIIAKTKEFPPRIHNLVRLADMSGVIVSEEDRLFLDKLSYYYLETRYPKEVIKVSKQINRRLAKKYFDKTREIIKCLKQRTK